MDSYLLNPDYSHKYVMKGNFVTKWPLLSTKQMFVGQEIQRV